MDPLTLAALVLAAATAAGFGIWAFKATRRAARHEKVHARTQAAGIREPATLHPKINEHQCICTGACVTVCPEKDVLGMIDGKPALLNPSACIGHGECLRACPVDAISLVIGSESRGVDLPMLAADFQTSVPGLYIAGELGGMGLIHNAVNQGSQAMRAIVTSLRAAPAVQSRSDAKDVIIVGAGPAGLSAALAAKAAGLQFSVLEQEKLGGALRSFPRQKVVMTAPVDMALYGKIKLRRTTKEALLELWDEIVKKTELHIETGIKVNEIKREPDGTFLVETTQGERRARRVLLAIGRRGTPRKLGVTGEELDKVTYKLIEPEQYRDHKLCVFGGGDAAVETALILAKEPGVTVTLVHRNERFDRIKPANQELLDSAQKEGRLTIKTATKPSLIAADAVTLECGGVKETVPNDYVFVLIGGELPTAWLAKIGIDVKTFRGEALPSAQP